MSYAHGTTVTTERSRAELDRILAKAGADERGFVTNPGLVQVGFKIHGIPVRIGVQHRMPREIFDEAHANFIAGDGVHGWKSWTQAKRNAWAEKQADQEERERWRVLVLLVKAKLEAIELGYSTVEREFLADIVAKDGRTVGEYIIDQLADRKAPTLMLGDGR